MERLSDITAELGSKLQGDVQVRGRCAALAHTCVACRPASLWRHAVNAVDWDDNISYCSTIPSALGTQLGVWQADAKEVRSMYHQAQYLVKLKRSAPGIMKDLRYAINVAADMLPLSSPTRTQAGMASASARYIRTFMWHAGTYCGKPLINGFDATAMHSAGDKNFEPTDAVAAEKLDKRAAELTANLKRVAAPYAPVKAAILGLLLLNLARLRCARRQQGPARRPCGCLSWMGSSPRTPSAIRPPTGA